MLGSVSLSRQSHSWEPVSGSAAHVKWSGGALLFGLFSKHCCVEREAEGTRVASPSDGHPQGRRVAEAPLSILAITPIFTLNPLEF